MANVPINRPQYVGPFVDARGYLLPVWLRWLNEIFAATQTIADNDAAIKQLQAQVATLAASVSALTVRVSTAESNIAANTAAIAALEVSVTALEVTSQAQTLAINSLEARVAALETYKASFAIKSVSADYTLVYSDFTVEVDASAAAVTITLPAANDLVLGEYHNVKKTDSTLNIVTIDGNGALIDGVATVKLLLPEWSVGLQYDGAAWRIL